MIVCTKGGMALRHYGQIPLGHDRDAIAGLASMVHGFHEGGGGPKKIENEDFTIFISKDEEPFAKARDGSLIKLLKGDYVNAVVSINNLSDLLPATELFKDHDHPLTFTGEIKRPSYTEVLNDMALEVIRAYKNK